MCNLYSITTNQAAIIALFRVVNRYVGNLASLNTALRGELLSMIELRLLAVGGGPTLDYPTLHFSPGSRP